MRRQITLPPLPSPRASRAAAAHTTDRPRRWLQALLPALLGALFAAAALAPAAAQQADEDSDAFALFSRFAAAPEMTLEFRQRSYGKDGEVFAETDGVLSYRRPNQFRLQYASPDNPLIVSDGKTLWLYEADLAQAIAQPFASASKSGLLESLATGNLATLAKHYALSAGLGGDLRWLNAEASTPDAALRRISLGFDAATGDLRQIQLTDHFDGAIRMDITALRPRARAGAFAFTPPPGTDVIEQE